MAVPAVPTVMVRFSGPWKHLTAPNVPMYIEICQNYLKLGSYYDIGYRISWVRVRYRDSVGGIRTFRSPVFLLLVAKVPTGNFRYEERKYRGQKSP